MAVVYIHRRKDIEDPFLNVFYVGIGKSEKRAYQINSRRNEFWSKVKDKYGITVEITHKDILWEEACAIEKYLINFYGRRNIESGNLCNLTDGGDGAFGVIHTKETKKKYSERSKGSNNPMYGKSKELSPNWGKKHSEETKKKIRESAKRGENHPFFGKPSWNKGLTGLFEKEKNGMWGKKGELSPNWGKNHSEEAKKKISLANKGKKRTDEMNRKQKERMKMNPPMLGKNLSEEAKNKISLANKGKKRSPEFIEKMREQLIKNLNSKKHENITT